MSTAQPDRAGSADHTVAELVSTLSSQLSELVRDEMALATVELKRKGARAGVGIGLGGAAGVLALSGFGVLLAAVVLGLATVMAAWLAAILVGVVLLALAGGLGLAGVGQVRRATPPVPEQALHSTKRDIETVKESIHR